MNRLKRISYRSPCCWLQRLQLFSSSLNSEINIPPRIERGPTDILCVLERSLQKNLMSNRSVITNDPYLIPKTRNEHFTYLLSYESGKKTAKWIHKEHRDLFPKDLSEPRIEAFLPPVIYTDRSQVSEEILLQVISKTNVQDALDIYKLLEGDVSNTTKQALLELLCFSNADSNTFSTFPLERWFFTKKKQPEWSSSPVVKELYNFLLTQDLATIAKAHNAMIVGYAKWQKVDEAWLLYQNCVKDDVPLNVTTYNYVIQLLPELFERNIDKKTLHDILDHMKEKGITPNLRTLNAALRALSYSTDYREAKSLAVHLLIEFKRLKVEFSLASYFYAIPLFANNKHNGYNIFRDMINSISEQNLIIQDPDDVKFFIRSMAMAHKFSCKELGNKIQNIFLTGNNYNFLTCSSHEYMYFYSYLLLMLSTCTIDEFFKVYYNIVPYYYIPDHKICAEILSFIKLHTAEEMGDYLSKFWLDLKTYQLTTTDLGFIAIEIMSRITSEVEPLLRTTFANAAKEVWHSIQQGELEQNISTSVIGHIVLILLTNDNATEARDVLTYTIKNLNSFLPMMTKNQVDQLFDLCISNNYFTEALLILEYCMNVGFQDIVNMAKLLYDNKEFSSVERTKLMALIGDDLAVSMDETKLK